jgi:hypothetical protein
MTAKIVLSDGVRWVVQWSDGALSLEASQADADICVEYPTICHPDHWTQDPILVELRKLGRIMESHKPKPDWRRSLMNKFAAKWGSK